MPETVNDKTVFSLLEVMRSIQNTLSARYSSAFWVMAEMNKLNYYPHSGHCYPELVEKKEGRVIAQARANLWRDDYRRINTKFRQVLQEPLKDGIKILFTATISFDPVYGLSLVITDIDPGYTLGDLEREKQESVARLKQEGLFDRNRALHLPRLPQRVAVISVESSKGYADFLKVIGENQWGYRFFHLLFPALLQGDKAVESILHQLARIRKVMVHFDVVAIIRGGGGDIGLSCYNNYQLAKEIALFPLPVITGIGHATNQTVCEMIAFQNAITPTKIAEYLLQQFHNFSVPVQQAEEKIAERSRRLIAEEKERLITGVKYFRSVTQGRLLRSRNDIEGHRKALAQQTGFKFAQERESLAVLLIAVIRGSAQFQRNQAVTLDNMARNVGNMSPERVLKRGYSITLLNGKALKSFEEVGKGQMIHTILSTGKIVSEVQSVRKPEDHE